MINNIPYIFILLVLIVLKPNQFETINKLTIFNYTFIYFLLLLYFLTIQRLKDKNWLRFDVIFLVGFSIVHIQIPFLFSLGFEPTNTALIWLNKDVVNYATWMSVVSINIWMIGYTIIKNTSISTNQNKFKPSRTSLKLIDYISFLILLSLLYSASSALLSRSYNLGAWGAMGVYLLMVLRPLLYLRIVYFFITLERNDSLKTIARDIFLSNKLFSINVLLFTFAFLMTGDRGEVLAILLAIAASYTISIRKISFKLLITALILGSFMFTIIGLGRSSSIENEQSQSIFEKGLEIYKTTDTRDNITDELASSVRIQYRALDYFPEKHDFLYGKTHLPAVLEVIPFGSTLVTQVFDIDDIYLGSAKYFTYLGQGLNPTYGEGSEILADLYINYSLYGTVLVMFLFGVYSKVCYTKSKQNSIVYILLYIVLITLALKINRGTLMYLYKTSFHIVLFHFIFNIKFRIT